VISEEGIVNSLYREYMWVTFVTSILLLLCPPPLVSEVGRHSEQHGPSEERRQFVWDTNVVTPLVPL
jgi:hypothetical protein